MEIFHSIEEYRRSGFYSAGEMSAVMLGKFDGIHIGHTKLIRNIIQHVRKCSGISVVFAIEMADGSILSHEERALVLKELGVDLLIECPFSRQFMSLGPEEFVRNVLSDTLHAGYVCVGPDFVFGHHRAGTAVSLKEYGKAFGFETVILEKERYLGEDVSSTRVRSALFAGDMELAGNLLGRSYPIAGEVAHGRHIGTGIGIPTINVIPQKEKILPPDGVYASVVDLPDQTRWKGLTNIGVRPTVGGTQRRAETTLLDFHSNLYGESVTIRLLRFIRPEKKFDDLDALRAQILRDREEAWPARS